MMGKKVKEFNGELMEVSKEAKKFWGKQVEEKLPKPPIDSMESCEYTAAMFAIDIMQYARGAESRGEYLFRHEYLKPLFEHFAEHLNVSWAEDKMGNFAVYVGENPTSVMHVGHMDTVHDYDHSPYQEINIVEAAGKCTVSLAPIPKNSEPKVMKGERWVEDTKYDHHYVTYALPTPLGRCLGADDGCAIATMLFLIMHESEGTYVFTRGEEIGCVGIKYMLDESTDDGLLDFNDYSIAIEVDRKGTTEIISSMSPGKTASQTFVNSLAKALNMGHKSGTGTITDVGYVAKHVKECVNLAAGYNAQHSDRETTELIYLDTLATRLLSIDWSTLETAREPNDYKRHTPVNPHRNRGSGSLWGDDWYGNSSYVRPKENTYGDYAEEPSEEKRPFKQLMDECSSIYQQEAWVRKNVGFLVEFLTALNISPEQMDNICQYGQIDPPSDNQE